MNYNQYLKSLKYYSRDADKERTFNYRLNEDYNREEITYNNELYKSIIQTGKIGSNSEAYYTISVSNDLKLKSGDIIHWNRINRDFMIFYPRQTEKNYFIARLYEAQYDIAWIDNYGDKKFIYGVIKSINDTIKKQNISNLFIDTIDGDMVLYIPLNKDTTDFLKRGRTIKIKNRNWKINGWNDLTFENIAEIGLSEVLNNEYTDTEDTPGSENIYYKKEIISNLDNILYIALNNIIPLEIKTLLNEEQKKEKYIINTVNCEYNNINNEIFFNTLDTALVNIIGEDSHIIKSYRIEVKPEIEEKIIFKIQGKSLIKNSVKYSYKILGYINGIEVDYNNYNFTWIIPEDCKIKKTSDREIFLETKNIGKHTLAANIQSISNFEQYVASLDIESEDLI